MRREAHGGLQGGLPWRRRGPDRRRPVPRRPHGHARGVLPHLQRAARLRPPAGAHLRPAARGAGGPRGPSVASASAQASWSSSSRPGSYVREAILAKRARLDGVDIGHDVAHRDRLRGHQQHPGARGRTRFASSPMPPSAAGAHAGARPPRAPPAQRAARTGACDLAEILDASAREFGVERAALLARDRRPAVACARQVAMYLARELTDHSLPEIGRGVGGRNHATVIHAINRVTASRAQTDPDMRTRRRQPAQRGSAQLDDRRATATIHTASAGLVNRRRTADSQRRIRRPCRTSTQPLLLQV